MNGSIWNKHGSRAIYQLCKNVVMHTRYATKTLQCANGICSDVAYTVYLVHKLREDSQPYFGCIYVKEDNQLHSCLKVYERR